MENSKITWTHHTFSGWQGCTNVSEGCAHCLDPDTPVIMGDLSEKALGAIEPSDLVWGFDEQDKGGWSMAVVEKVWKSRKQAIEILTKHGRIIASEDHLFLTTGENQWRKTSELTLADQLRHVEPASGYLPRGEPSAIVSLRSLGVRDLVDIQTSTRTFVAANLMTHNCYAETMANRWGKKIWGKGAPRELQSDSYWEKPLLWNKRAGKKGIRERVFCGSMKDVFDEEVPTQWRERLWELIDKTPHLDWLLLTKRPQCWEKFLPWPAGKEPKNIWLGMTVENNRRAQERLGFMKARSKLTSENPCVTFLSLEPLLEYVDIQEYLGVCDWFILGGESGPSSRICDVGWLVQMANQVKEHQRQGGEAALFVKQLGSKPMSDGKRFSLDDYKGLHMEIWPEELRVQEFPASRFQPMETLA